MTLIASVGGVLKCNSRQMFSFFINSRCAQEAPDLAQEFKAFHSLRTRKNSDLSLPTNIKFHHLRKFRWKSAPYGLFFQSK